MYTSYKMLESRKCLCIEVLSWKKKSKERRLLLYIQVINISNIIKIILQNMIIKREYYRNALKRARVIILIKRESRNDPTNYRRISLLSLFSRIFEKAMLYQLLVSLNSKHFFFMIFRLVIG